MRECRWPSSVGESISLRRRWRSGFNGSKRAGVITGYRAEVDPKAIGFPIAAVVRIRPTTRQLQKIPELAREMPEVVDCYRITGEDCFFVKLHLRSMDDLEEILDRFIVLGQTTTSIVHSTPVAGRPLPLDL